MSEINTDFVEIFLMKDRLTYTTDLSKALKFPDSDFEIAYQEWLNSDAVYLDPIGDSENKEWVLKDWR